MNTWTPTTYTVFGMGMQCFWEKKWILKIKRECYFSQCCTELLTDAVKEKIISGHGEMQRKFYSGGQGRLNRCGKTAWLLEGWRKGKVVMALGTACRMEPEDLSTQ